MMQNIPVWEVILEVYGSITVEKTLRFSQLKGFRLNDKFYSDIEIKRSQTISGVEATITAFAPNEELAREAAIFFFGQMLDTLAIQIDQALYLNFNDYRIITNFGHKTLRRVKKEEWQNAFQEARLLSSHTTTITYLRALGWYRKGLYTEDPFDKFLAFWNSIEIVASKYHPPIPEGRSKQTKSQIWESFKALWGDCDYWPIIKGQNTWIDDNYDIRKTIAHGTQPIDINTVKEVSQKLDIIRQVSFKFLLEWREKRLNLLE
ncbi:methylamine utilization protein MauJ [Nostoc parmelioides]|uniref:Apea-like HEPN domain-containing protein n=1 Tax=Nostoc parmelioides FACHB-3921 TaxID=2692909 RepID=A0ABR8BQ53_9NOSO|nr:methylamine utilization protein MauJ [Nostoc parmelioides]MBD2255449.1 hypothetical protein [Nostoc parmelioides FACHB-3921]